MFEEIQMQDMGNLKQRLTKISYGDTGIISQKQFTEFLQVDLRMSENDLMKLIKVAGFTKITSQNKTMRIDTVSKNLEDRVLQSQKLADDCIKQVAKSLKREGYDIETAMNYLDIDRSGSISRDEMMNGFNRMKIPLNER